MDMNQRHKMILDAIVSMYIRSGEPIASRALQDALNISVSSATLRNEMARLTKLGYLNQPHVSAGRIPTNKAYRYYVDNLDTSRQIAPADRRAIQRRFDSLDADSGRFLQGAARLFSGILREAVVIVPPYDPELQFVNFTFLRTGKYSVVLVGTTSRGEVATRVIRLSGDIDAAELDQMARVINQRLSFVCFSDLNRNYFSQLASRLEKENAVYGDLLKGTLALIEEASSKSVYVYGQENLVEDGRFGEGIADVFKLLADTSRLKNIVTPRRSGISVVFGDELGLKTAENLCMISTRYNAGNSINGAVAVVCPRTVDYQRMFLAVDYFAKLITRSLTGLRGEKTDGR